MRHLLTRLRERFFPKPKQIQQNQRQVTTRQQAEAWLRQNATDHGDVVIHSSGQKPVVYRDGRNISGRELKSNGGWVTKRKL